MSGRSLQGVKSHFLFKMRLKGEPGRWLSSEEYLLLLQFGSRQYVLSTWALSIRIRIRQLTSALTPALGGLMPLTLKANYICTYKIKKKNKTSTPTLKLKEKIFKHEMRLVLGTRTGLFSRVLAWHAWSPDIPSIIPTNHIHQAWWHTPVNPTLAMQRQLWWGRGRKNRNFRSSPAV